MLERVSVGVKHLDDYRQIVGEEEIAAIRNLADSLKGARVLHINATAYGGGVAEILTALVPLMQDVGLEAEWQVIEGDDEFFAVTKASHNGLQGMQLPLTHEMQDIWRRYNQQNADRLEGEYDFVIVHDPQPAGLLASNGRQPARNWIWRCHIDTSAPNPEFWAFYAPYLNDYDSLIFTLEQYVGPQVEMGRVRTITPTIDPLSPKNAPIPLDEARQVVASFGIDTSRPLMTQVSRFDPWKDPLGVIDAYRLVKEQIPDLQLGLIGGMATDDPEGWHYLDKTSRRAGEDFDVFILHNFHRLGNYEVGCFQTASDVVVQKSLREGFGLVVTEALWKGQPVIGGNTGGIPLQVIDGVTGYLVDSVEQCAARVLQLLADPANKAKMGAAAREHVRDNFLITRQLRNYLQLFTDMESGAVKRSTAAAAADG